MGVANGGDCHGEDTTMVESNRDRYDGEVFIGVCIVLIARQKPFRILPTGQNRETHGLVAGWTDKSVSDTQRWRSRLGHFGK